MGRSADGIFFSIWWYEWALPLCIRANKYTDQFERTVYSGITEDVMETYFYTSIQVLCFKVTYNKFLGECVLPPMHSNCRCAIDYSKPLTDENLYWACESEYMKGKNSI